jgi:hypothetical protein
VPSVGLRGSPRPLARVAPGDSSRSVLLRKLLGGDGRRANQANLGVDGDRMPPGQPVDDSILLRIEQWIDAGAHID